MRAVVTVNPRTKSPQTKDRRVRVSGRFPMGLEGPPEFPHSYGQPPEFRNSFVSILAQLQSQKWFPGGGV